MGSCDSVFCSRQYKSAIPLLCGWQKAFGAREINKIVSLQPIWQETDHLTSQARVVQKIAFGSTGKIQLDERKSWSCGTTKITTQYSKEANGIWVLECTEKHFISKCCYVALNFAYCLCQMIHTIKTVFSFFSFSNSSLLSSDPCLQSTTH